MRVVSGTMKVVLILTDTAESAHWGGQDDFLCGGLSLCLYVFTSRPMKPTTVFWIVQRGPSVFVFAVYYLPHYEGHDDFYVHCYSLLASRRVRMYRLAASNMS